MLSWFYHCTRTCPHSSNFVFHDLMDNILASRTSPVSVRVGRTAIPVMADESSAIEFPMEASETAVVGPVASPKRVGRPKKSSRPKIDIDEEIGEANRLALVTKKMMQAAKSAQRNSQRSKQRLVRKAGKLSAEDLERIATLKRCGLFVPDPMEDATSSTGSAPSSSSTSTSGVSAPVQRVNTKLFSRVSQVQGAADLLASMHQHVPGAMSSAGPDLAGNSSTAALNTAMPRVPRGRRLFPARSTAVMASISEAASSAGDGPPLLPVGERPSAEVEHGDDAM